MILDGQAIGTITNDDAPPIFISIGDVTQAEGNSGTAAFVFYVTLSSASSQTITVNYATADNTALSKGNSKDYNAINNGTLTFAPGEISKIITVDVIGDTATESNETFFVNLSNAVNAILADDQGLGTILNDEGALQTVAAPVFLAEAELLVDLQVQPILAEAIRRWHAIGANAVSLVNVDIQLVRLPGQIVGWTQDKTIFIDPAAAGHGWFVDSSPWNDAEFETSAGPGELERLDLLTVVMHELGHVLGFEHAAEADKLMADVLAVGVRILPAADVVQPPFEQEFKRVDLSNLVPAISRILSPEEIRTNSDDGKHRWMPSAKVRVVDRFSLSSVTGQRVQAFAKPIPVARTFETEIRDRLLEEYDSNFIDDELLDSLAGLLPRHSVLRG